MVDLRGERAQRGTRCVDGFNVVGMTCGRISSDKSTFACVDRGFARVLEHGGERGTVASARQGVDETHVLSAPAIGGRFRCQPNDQVPPSISSTTIKLDQVCASPRSRIIVRDANSVVLHGMR
jgi:hypothetical protein